MLATNSPTGAPSVVQGPVYLENDGTGHFQNRTVTGVASLNVSAKGVAAGDVDADGDVDVAVVHTTVFGWWVEHSIMFNLERHVHCTTTGTRNSVQSIELYAEANHAMVAAVGTTPLGVWLPDLGRLGIDPATMLTLPLALFANTGRLDVPLFVPDDPVFAGLRVYVQAIDLWQENGQPQAHLTGVTSFVIQ